MSQVLAGISGEVMLAVVDGLRTQRLRPPFSATALGRFCGAGSEEMAGFLGRLQETGASPETLVIVLKALAAERAAGRQQSEIWDLVLSGPDAAEVTHRDTGAVVRELFLKARGSVTVVGYAVHKARDIFRALAENMEKRSDLAVDMYLDVQRRHSDTTAPEQLLAAFATRFKQKEWPGSRLPRVFFDPRSLALDQAQRACLHAKCIVIDEETAFVSSANFTQAAQKRNIEAGLIVHSPALAGKLAAHFRALRKAGVLQPIPGICG